MSLFVSLPTNSNIKTEDEFSDSENNTENSDFERDIKSTQDRSTRPTDNQIDHLLSYIEEHRWFARGRGSSSVWLERQRAAWERLARHLNRIDGCCKSAGQWLKYWSDKRSQVKKKRDMGKDKDISKSDKRILAIIKQKPVWHWHKVTKPIKRNDNFKRLQRDESNLSSNIPTESSDYEEKLTQRLVKLEETRMAINTLNNKTADTLSRIVNFMSQSHMELNEDIARALESTQTMLHRAETMPYPPL